MGNPTIWVATSKTNDKAMSELKKPSQFLRYDRNLERDYHATRMCNL